jgi:hypothetical protein
MYKLLFIIGVWIAPAMVVLALGLWGLRGKVLHRPSRVGVDLERQLRRRGMAAKRPS